MKTYQVWMKDTGGRCIEVEAEDVNLESEGTTAFWNLVANDGGDVVTVGAFPFNGVDYIVSVK
jgi:hypothetical protein